MRRLFARLLAKLIVMSAATAAAQTAPPTQLAAPPNEALPVWHPVINPVQRAEEPIFLDLAMRLHRADQLRTAGLLISSVGWLALFGGGILEVYADVGGISGGDPSLDLTDPSRIRAREQTTAGAISLFSIGGVLAAGGFALFVVGQTHISAWHRAHPRDPLPPLSGFGR